MNEFLMFVIVTDENMLRAWNIKETDVRLVSVY